MGSVSSLGRLLGVPRSTLRGWLAGAHARRDTSEIEEFGRYEQRREVLSRHRERRLRHAPASGIKVRGTYNYPGERPRMIDLGRWMDDRLERVVDAYLDGASPAELGREFAGLINDGGFYEREFGDEPDYGFDVDFISGWL